MFFAIAVLGLVCDLTTAEITFIEAKFPLLGTRSPPGSPWPYPQVLNTTNVTLNVDAASFKISSNAMDCEIISKAITRYDPLIFIVGKNVTASENVLKTLDIQVTDFNKGNCSEFYPTLGDNETYTLEVKEDGGAKLSALTVWGALRGLETFSQLVFVNEATKTYHINETMIEDGPTFGYRGILLDTARHYQPMKVLKQNLDAMSYNKMNVFHWHIVDDQSWPFESLKYPNLTEKGAYNPRLIYTRKDIAEIIEYARLRGIRVMPEFDTPGHTLGLGKAFPGVITPCYGFNETAEFTPNYNEHAEKEILNPILNETYDLVKEIFQEFREVFVDDYVHVGMDEVYYACWESNPNIAEFMKQENIATVNQLEQYYVKRTLQNVRDVGYKYMVWQDPVDNGVEMAEDSIIQVWKDTSLDIKLKPWHEYIQNISQHGYKMVVSACWYLNYISYGMDWKKYYDCDIQGFTDDESVKELVIGGEACLWGEYVDATNLVSRLWPRASAVAERLWSSTPINSTDDAQYRLDEQRCRMLRRGIPTAPILNGYCGDYEWDLDEPPKEICKVPEKCKDCPSSGHIAKPLVSLFIMIVVFNYLLN